MTHVIRINHSTISIPYTRKGCFGCDVNVILNVTLDVATAVEALEVCGVSDDDLTNERARVMHEF